MRLAPLKTVHATNIEMLECISEHPNLMGEAKIIMRRLSRAYRLLDVEPDNRDFQRSYYRLCKVVDYYMDIACEEEEI